MKKLLLLILVLAWNTGAATHAAASASQANVQTAIDLCSSGDTVTVPAGTGTWGTVDGNGEVLINNKSIVLKGAGIDVTTVTVTQSVGYMEGLRLEGSTQNSEITGFTFNITAGAASIAVIHGSTWRIHGNKFTSAAFNVGIMIHASADLTHPYGLIDNNTFTNCRVYASTFGNQDQGFASYLTNLNLGTAEAVYIENNQFVFTVYGNAIDGNYGGKWVFRNNKVTDVYCEAHSVSIDNARASRKWEYYNDTLVQSSRTMDDPPFLIRGGTGAIFNNVVTGTWPFGYIGIDNYRSYTDVGGCTHKCDGTALYDGNVAGQSGYPCRDQIGRSKDASSWTCGNQGPHQDSVPAYQWNNILNGAQFKFHVNAGSNCPACSIQIVKNRDFFDSVPMPTYYAYTYPHPLRGLPPSMATTSISPTSGKVAAKDTLNGSGFQTSQGNGYVHLVSAGGVHTNCSIISWSNSKVAYTIPSISNATYKAFVINNDMQVDSSQTFSVSSASSKKCTITIVR